MKKGDSSWSGGGGAFAAQLEPTKLPPPAPPPPATASASPPAPAALASSALHAARLRFGRNDVPASVVSWSAFLRFPIASPTTGIIVVGLLLNLVVYIDYWVVLMLVSLLLLQGGVLIGATRAVRGSAAALHRCFQHSSAVAYREGTWALLGAAQLVPGDLIQLVQGGVVHADCTLYRGSLLLDMVQLTGRTEFTPAEPGHLLKAGTVVVDGAGSAIVRYTGHETFVGLTVRLLDHLAPQLTRPLVQRTYMWICFVLLVVMITAEVVLYGFFSGWYRQGNRIVAGEMMLYALACLPLLLDLAVLQAVRGGAGEAMQRAQAIVLRLGALLSLASADTLIVDKSGTLTTGVYVVADVFRSFLPHYSSRESLVQLMALATKWREPCVHALRRAVLRCADLDRCDQHTRLAYVEHEGEHRTSTVLRRGDGRLLRVTEGHVEAVLALLVDSKGAEGVTEQMRTCAEARRLTAAWGIQGLRTRAVAVAVETGPWELAGLVTFADTLRDDAAEMLRLCDAAGVEVTIASGDSRAVVIATAAALCGAAPSSSYALASSSVMTGGDLPSLAPWQVLNASALAAASASDSFLSADIGGVDGASYAACHIYAEMQPEHKVTLVRLLQQTGRCVAVLGDGVNDAAAAYVADCGVALVSPDRGTLFPMQGALWGADIALPSSQLTSAARLVHVSREVFATVYALFFHAFTVFLQSAVVVLLVPFIAPRWMRMAGDSRWTRTTSLPPSNLFTPLYACVTIITLLCQARQPGDTALWERAPCRHNYRVAAVQAAAMACVGVGASVPLALGPSPVSLLWRGEVEYRQVSLRGTSLLLYLVYLQLLLSPVCASPLRCGLRFWRTRFVYVVTCTVVLGVVLYVCVGCFVSLQAAVFGYCAVVAALQDGAKMAVHAVSYRLDCFGYRGCVDGMARGRQPHEQRRRRQQRWQRTASTSVNDNDDGGESPFDVESEDERDASVELRNAPSQARRPPSAAANAVLGCLVPLEMRLVSAAPAENAVVPEEE